MSTSAGARVTDSSMPVIGSVPSSPSHGPTRTACVIGSVTSTPAWNTHATCGSVVDAGCVVRATVAVGDEPAPMPTPSHVDHSNSAGVERHSIGCGAGSSAIYAGCACAGVAASTAAATQIQRIPGKRTSAPEGAENLLGLGLVL